MKLVIKNINNDHDTIEVQDEETGTFFNYNFEVYNCESCDGDPHVDYKLNSCTDQKMYNDLKDFIPMCYLFMDDSDHMDLLDEIKEEIEHLKTLRKTN